MKKLTFTEIVYLHYFKISLISAKVATGSLLSLSVDLILSTLSFLSNQLALQLANMPVILNFNVARFISISL